MGIIVARKNNSLTKALYFRYNTKIILETIRHCWGIIRKGREIRLINLKIRLG